MVDVAYIGGAGDARDERLEILALQKLSTMERASADAYVTVLDGGDLSDAELDAAVTERTGQGVRLLVLFRLSHGVNYRQRRDALMAAGAADVMDADDPSEIFLTRVRALMLKDNPPKVLVVEDDKSIADWAVTELQKAGMNADTVSTLADARARFQAGRIDALVVDRGLPDGDGLDLVAELRGLGIKTPALFFTALNETPELVRGIEGAQADDYICKPVHADELCVRVRMALREFFKDDTLYYGPMEINRRDKTIKWRGRLVKFRDKQRDMLIYLAERPGLAIPQQVIYLDVWGKVYMEIGSNPVTAARSRIMQELRAALKPLGEEPPEFIVAVGNSYMFQGEALLKLPLK
ncbi:MAG: response regulator transcription factor [Arenibacterium sp.]